MNEIVRRTVAAAQPQRIILFGSAATGRWPRTATSMYWYSNRLPMISAKRAFAFVRQCGGWLILSTHRDGGRVVWGEQGRHWRYRLPHPQVRQGHLWASRQSKCETNSRTN